MSPQFKWLLAIVALASCNTHNTSFSPVVTAPSFAETAAPETGVTTGSGASYTPAVDGPVSAEEAGRIVSAPAPEIAELAELKDAHAALQSRYDALLAVNKQLEAERDDARAQVVALTPKAVPVAQPVRQVPQQVYYYQTQSYCTSGNCGGGRGLFGRR